MASSAPDRDRVALPGTRIAEFTPADAEAVALMFNDSNEGWPGGFTQGVPMTAERVMRRQHEQAPLATFIVWEGDRVAGYCSFFAHPDEPDRAGFIGLINVATSFQGRGYGRDLLKAALARTIALGFARLDLGTWSGNMKAVPLYKKTGFFWVPESNVHMENYMPLLLGLPALADFWAEADWYGSMVRDLSVQEDLILQGKMRVYPYEFRHGDRFVKATIDAAARGLTALETERWRIACSVDDRTLIAGRPGRVRWEVENRTGRPLPLTLLAGAGTGLTLRKEETVLVRDRYTAEAPLTADLDLQQPVFGRRRPCVESLLLLDGQPIRLETGLEVQRPFSIGLEGMRAGLLVGQRREIALHLRNHMDAPATARLTVVPSPGLELADAVPGAALRFEAPMEPESYGGASLCVTALHAGAHTLELRPEALVGGTVIPMAPVTLPLPAIAPGTQVAFVTDQPDGEEYRDREVRVESASLRLVVGLREGRWHLEDSASGEYLAGGIVPAGPPFAWVAQARVTHQPTIERREGATAVILRGALPHLPGAVVTHEFLLTQDRLLRVQTTISSACNLLEGAQAAVWIWNERTRLRTVALPTVHGLVVSDDPEWPDWSDAALLDADMYAEGWLAMQAETHVIGLLWSEARRVELGQWFVAVRQDAAGLAPGDRCTLPPIYVYAGPGDWRTVRERWRALLRPDAPPAPPPIRAAQALQAPAIPAALLAGANTLALSVLGEAPIAGRLRFEAPAAWRISPHEHDLDGLCVGHDATLAVTVERAEGAPRAASVRARLRTERADTVALDGALLDLGSGDAVRVEERTLADQRVLQVDNGLLRFRMAPGFIGSVIALETCADGINHLLSPFPQPREFGWTRPWYGGVYAAIYPPGWDAFPDHARLYEETLTAEETEEIGALGRRWRGVRVGGLLQGTGLRGLELRASYLTLQGSSLLAIRLAVRNHTSAILHAHSGLVCYLQPGGAVEGAELLGAEPGRRLLRAQRTIDVAGGPWVGACNPRTGRTIALIGAGGAEMHVVGVDWGPLGAHAGAQVRLRLLPGEERSTLAFLALAGDEAEARAYGVLAGATSLP